LLTATTAKRNNSKAKAHHLGLKIEPPDRDANKKAPRLTWRAELGGAAPWGLRGAIGLPRSHQAPNPDQGI
jgi:hypothetical protein